MNVQDLITGVRDSVSSGASAGTIVILLGVLVAVAIVVGAGFYIAHLLSPKGRLDALLDSRMSQSKRNPWPARITVAVALVIAVLAMGSYLDSPRTCAQCHKEAAYYKSLKATPHANVSCMSCHGSSGVTAPVNNTITYARWGYGYYVENQPPAKTIKAQVDSQQCLNCHSDVRQGVKTANGIKIRHSDIIAQGTPCLECHTDVAHKAPQGSGQPLATAGKGPSMNQCLPCHDGKKASSECKTCHAKDLGLAKADTLAKANDVKVSLASTKSNCYNCHDEKPCLRCHGATMPHPAGWGPNNTPGGERSPGDHAKAGFSDRDSCYRCHHVPGKVFQTNDQSCGGCHPTPGGMHGGKPWLKEHGLVATGQHTGSLSDCFICHSSSLCAYCHPADYVKKYNPRNGPDQYTRDIPMSPWAQQFSNGL